MKMKMFTSLNPQNGGLTMNDLSAYRKLAQLRKQFVQHESYLELSNQFDRLIERRRFELAENNVFEARGIAVIGGSGSGKTTAVDHLFRKHTVKEFKPDEIPPAELVNVRVPSPATVKYVGITTLAALGYPMQRERTGPIIWDLVKFHLRQRQTLFVHFDEAQDFFCNQQGREMQSVINTIKSLMQNKDWPVGIILSGMPALKDLINQDPQLARRFTPVAFSKINATSHAPEIIQLLRQYCQMADLELFDQHTEIDFVRRLVKAAADEFGLTIEIMISAIEEAIFAGDKSLEHQHFASAFRTRSGCVDARNPFLAEEYRSFVTLRILEDLEENSMVAPHQAFGGDHDITTGNKGATPAARNSHIVCIALSCCERPRLRE